MNLIFSVPEWLRVLAWVSTAAALLAGLATQPLRRQASALRHLFWLLALCAPLAALPLVWMHPRLAIPVLIHSPVQVSTALGKLAQPLPSPLPVSASGDQDSAVPLSEATSASSVQLRFKPSVNLWFGVWLVGIIFFTTRFLITHFRLSRLVRSESAPAGEILMQQLREAKRHIGFARTVRLLVSRLTPVPFCHGVFQPFINLPETWCEWDHKRLQICLTHELAHLMRYDLLTLLIGRLACIVCWFNPLVWLAAGKLRHEAEKAADDLVLARGFGPAVYAAALVALAERCQAGASSESPLALAMARRNRLSSRISAILDDSLRRHPPGRTVRWTVSVAAFGVLVAALAIRLTAAPPEGSATDLTRDLITLDSRTRQAVGETAYRAIKAGDLQTIDAFLQRGLDANEDLQYSDSLLYQAVDERQIDIVKLLLAHGADAKAKTAWGDAPAKRACWRGYREIANLLIRAGATVDERQYATGMGDVAGLEASDKKQPITAKAARDNLSFAVASGHENTFDWLWERLGPLDAVQKDKLLGDLFENAGRWGQAVMLRHLQGLGASLAEHGAKALAGAVGGNHLEAARYLLEAGVSPIAAALKRNLLLRDAAGEGQLEMVRLLLDHGADVNAGDPETFTPLSWAAYCGKEDVCLLLLERGADGNIVDDTGENAAWHAAGGEHCPKALEVMLKQGVKISGINKGGETVLHAMEHFVPPRPGQTAFLSRVYSAPEMEAYDVRERRVIELLAAAGMDCKGQEGSKTPLMSALDSGHNAAARVLLEHGADFTTKDKEGNGAIYYLIERDWFGPPPLDLVETFLNRGGDPNTEVFFAGVQPRTSYSLLAAAMVHAADAKDVDGFRRVVQTLINHGARFPQTADEKIQALLQAAAAGNVAQMQEAVRQGASVNAADSEGWDALAVSAALDYEECADWLLANGAVPSNREIKPFYDLLTLAVDHDRAALVDALIAKGAIPRVGYASLRSAIEHGDLHLFETLLRAGVDPKSDGSGTETINGKNYALHDSLLLYICIDHGQVAMAKALLDRGSNADPANLDHGRNLAWWAVSEHQPQILQALLDHGAGPTQKDEDGMSALSLAQKSRLDMVPMLEAAIKHAQESNPTATPIPKPADKTSRKEDDAAEVRERAALNRKAESLIIPQVNFQATPLADAIEFLRQETARLCAAEPDPDQRGINIFVKIPRSVMATATPPQDAGKTATPQPSPGVNSLPATSAISLEARSITLTLRQRSLLEILRAVAAQVDMKVKVERYAVSLVPPTEQIEPMLTAEFTVAMDALGSPAASPSNGGGGQGMPPTVFDPRPFLEAKGVMFPAGSSAAYRVDLQKLIVRNTEANIDRLKVLFRVSDPTK